MNHQQLNRLQAKILEIAIDFDAFCSVNEIKYYLMGGSALGAVRHNGFIPWDDDFDVFMDYENYEKFLTLIKYKLDTDKYYFQRENTEEWPLFFSKLRMNNTTFIEKGTATRNIHHGIYIDVMCLNYAFENKVLRLLQYLSARILTSSALAKSGYITESKFKKMLLLISKIITAGSLKSLFLNFVRSNNSTKTRLVGHFFGRAPFAKTTFPVDFLSVPRLVLFEGVLLPVPKDVEKYLKVRFGSGYMELPSKEEMAKFPSHAYIVDTKNSYEEYVDVQS